MMTADLLLPIVLAVVVSVIAPLLMSWQVNRSRREEKKEDWARQDLIALQAQEAAELLVMSNAKIAAATEATNAKIDNVAITANVIHTLVNSEMTRVLKLQLVALQSQLVLLKNGPQINGVVATTVDVETQIDELQVVLAERDVGAKAVKAIDG